VAAGAIAGGAGAGALGGAIAGAQGTPNQYGNTTGSTQSTSQLQLGPLSQTEAQLQQNSLQQYPRKDLLKNF